MRLLHTADWHLGDYLGYVDRTADQLRAVDRILDHCAEQRVDVLVVAGDVFNEYRGETLAGLVRELARRLHPHLGRGMQAIFIPGNHDREYLFSLVETVEALAGEETARRVHFVSRPQVLRLPDPSGAFAVQFVLAPYPTTHRYLPEDVGVRGLARDERRQVLARQFAERIAAAQAELDVNRPAVLVSHVYVRTAETPTLYRMSEAEDVPIEPQDLPAWAYTALGHIHRPQVVGGRPAARYAGSPERLDAGECDDDKSCVLVELGSSGLIGEPSLLPLPATPIHSVIVRSGDDLDALAEHYPDRDRALVHLQVTWRPGQDNPYALVSELRRLFPRCFKLDHRPESEPSRGDPTGADPLDMAATVRVYLTPRLEGRPDAERLLRLADQLVEEVRDAATAD